MEEEEELIQSGQGTTENVITEEGKKILASAKRKALEQKVNPSIYGTDSSQRGSGGIDYKTLAGGHYAKAAERGNWSKWSLPDDMALQAFKEQDTTGLLLDAFIGASKLGVAGFLDMAASWDLVEISNVAQGKAMSDTGNWLQKQADKWQKGAEANTIYKDGDNMWNLPYWASQGQQLGYSGGIALEMGVEQFLLAATTQGVGNITGAGVTSARVAALASKSRYITPLVQQGLMGLSGGIREAYMNSRETQGEVYEKFLEAGFTEEEAKAKGNEAAHINFKTEAGPLIVLNALQNMFLFGGLSKGKAFYRANASPELKLGFSSFGEQLLEKVLPKTNSKALRRVTQYGVVPAITESMEESIQSIASQYGEWKVGDQKESFDPFNTQLRDEAIGGGLGGIFLGAGAKALSMFRSKLSGNALNEHIEQFIADSQNRTANAFIAEQLIMRDLKAASEAYQADKSDANFKTLQKAEKAVKEAKYNSHLANSINALEYDYLKGEGTTAFDSHVGQMQAILDAVKAGDMQALEGFGLVENGKEKFEGSFETILNTFEQNIKDSQFIKQSLENNIEKVTSDFSSAFDITRKEFFNSKHLEEVSNIEKEILEAKVLDTYYNQLSTEGKQKFDLQNELYALQQVEKDSTTKALSTEEKARMAEIEKELEGLKFTSKDSLLIPNMDVRGYINAEVSKISLGQAVDQNNTALKDLRDSAKIKSKVQEREEKRIKNAKSAKAVEAAKKKAEKAGVADAALKKKADKKLAEIERARKIAELNTKGPKVKKPTEVKPVEKSADPEPETHELLSQFLKEGKFTTDSAQEDISGEALSRHRVPQTQYSPELQERGKAFVERKDQEKGKKVTLDDVVRDSIERNGFKETEKVFNGIAGLMESVGRDISEADQIFEKYFGEELNLFGDFGAEQANDIANAAEDAAKNATKKSDNFDVNGKPVSTPKGIDPDSKLVAREDQDTRTNKTELKVGYNFQTYVRDGKVFTTTSTELQGENHFILDSEFVNTGDVLQIEVLNDDSQTISIWTNEGVERTTTWGEYKKGVAVGSKAYNNKIPMGIYKTVGKSSANQAEISRIEAERQAEIGTKERRSYTDSSGVTWTIQITETKDKKEVRVFGEKNGEKIPGEVQTYSKELSNEKIYEVNNSDAYEYTPIKQIKVEGKRADKINAKYDAQIKELDSGGEKVLIGHVHDATWYTPNNMSANWGEQAQIEMAKAGFETVSNARQSILDNGGTASIEIHREVGNLDNITKSDNTTPLRLSDATGDTQLALIKRDAAGNIILQSTTGNNIEVQLVNDLNQKNKKTGKNLFNVGGIADIRYSYTTPQGVKMYQAFSTMDKRSNSIKPNLREDLDPEIYNSLKFATLASAVLKNVNNPTILKEIEKEFGFTVSQAREIQSQIKDNLKIDIVSGLANYVAVFSRVSGGNIVLDNGAKVSIGGIVNSFNVQKFKNNFGEKGAILKSSFNPNYSLINSKTRADATIPTISAEGKVQSKYKGYNSVVKNFVYTNIRSHEITKYDGTKQWITDVQPMITYVLLDQKQVSKSSAEKASEAAAQEIEAVEQIEGLPQELTAELTPEELKILQSIQRTMPQDTNESRRQITPMQRAQIEEVISDGRVTGMTDLEFREMVDSLKHEFLGAMDFNGKVTVGELQENLDNLVESKIQPIIDSYRAVVEKVSKFPQLAGHVTELESRITKLEATIAEKDKITGEKGILSKEISKLFGFNLTEDASGDAEFDSSNNYRKSFLEKDIKLSYSARLKMAFFGIKQLRENSSQEEINELTGLPKYESPDYVELILKSVTTEIPSNWQVLIDKLSTRYQETGLDIFNQLKNSVEDLPQHLKNELLYKLISTKFTAHKIINSVQKGKDGAPDTFVLTVIDENSSKENIKLKNQIKDNFTFSSPLTMLDVKNNDRVLNLEIAKKYQAALKKHSDSKTFDKGYTAENEAILKDIFNALGITISDNTLTEYLKENNPFLNKQGILFFVQQKLDSLISTASTKRVVVTDAGNNIFDDGNKALNTIVDKEIALNGTNVARSIRVAGKTLQGVIQNTAATDILRELTEENSATLEMLIGQQGEEGGISYTKKNLLLNELRDNPQVRRILSLAFSSPDSYKVNGKDSFTDTEFDKLSDTDALTLLMGLYTNERGHETLTNKDDIRLGLEFRVGQMPFMTLSDKGRMLYMKTILLNGKDTDFSIVGNKIVLEDTILDLLFEQIFESEYNRILDAYSNVDPQINSFSEASKIFTFLPVFNILEVNGDNIHDIIKERLSNDEPMPSIDTFKTEAKRMLSEYINSEVDQKLDSSGQGLAKEAGLYEDGNLVNIDSKYVGKFKGSALEKGRKLFAEHAINNLMHQANMYQIFLGDMAYYAKFKDVIGKDGYVNSDVIKEEYLNIAEKIGEVVDKRSASLIAPGFTLANSSDAIHKHDKFLQLQISDVISTSDLITSFIENSKEDISKEERAAMDTVNDPNAKPDDVKNALALLKELNPDLAPYFKMEGTDAQEYNTWQAHIDILFRQGNLTGQEEAMLRSAYTKLSEGRFDEVTKEETSIVMQPIKPVYTGMVPLENSEGKVISMRPVYIKSSAFPLLPHVTKNLKIDNLRKNLEALEKERGMPVKASYQTANKIGSNKTLLTTEDLYSMTPEQLSTEMRDGRGVLESASITLDSKNFKIQQENPDKTDKALAKNQENMISMGSQFWKVLLGNGINDMTAKVFPNHFGKDLLEAAGIENSDMLSGEDLDKINFYVYDKFSKAKSTLLYNRIGLDRNIPFNNMTKAEKKEVLENVVEILREEITTRNYPEYLTESLNLITDDQGNISLENPLFLDTNANKFESLLLSLVSNSTIFHKLPGLGHISSSSEGFERVDNLENISENDRQGITWLNGIPRKLKSTKLEDGTITESEVIIKSHFRKTTIDENGNKTTDLIDLSTDTYSELILEDGKPVGRKLKMDMLDEELISQFSFRIPTSSHQSGVILKVVGFLPKESGDMLLVPAEHTVQLGEDYDIDKRYIYKSNYVFNGDKIEKLNYKKDLKEKDAFDKLYEAMFEEDVQESDKELQIRIKMYENAMIDIYKSVFQSTSKEVQQKIFKPLSVKEAKVTANLMEDRVNANKNPYFSSLSDAYQRKLLKAGADGKGGIGVHSNAVTMEAQMQRLSDENKLEFRFTTVGKDGRRSAPQLRSINIGGLESTGVLGRELKSLDGKRDIADQHGENQNVSTDNINEQVMAKRNENTYTMSVYALMASRGFDLTADGIVQNNNQPMHLPSLFINQPIIRDYVALRAKQDSLTGDFIADKEGEVLKALALKYGGMVIKPGTPITNFLSKFAYDDASKEMTGQKLYDTLTEKEALRNAPLQLAILQKFAILQAEARQLSDVQQLISLSSSGLGVSYFETLQRIRVLDTLPDSDIRNATKLIGEYATAKEDSIAPEASDKTAAQLEKEGYSKIGMYYWKPTTIEGVMLIDSLKGAQDLMDIFFPYKEEAINSVIEKIMAEKSVDLTKKSKRVLDQQYEIMREFKSFMSTYSNAGYFQGEINQERRRLFIDSKTNTSLASIIKELQDKRHPITSNPFIRNLIPQIKAITEPSLLLYNNTENTSLDSYTEYDAFGRMLLDDTTSLGEFNGEIMTPMKLAQDLISYAMLADSQKGATGFETLIPQKFLQIIGYNQATNFNFKKVSDHPTMLNTFVEQYFQHHPERATILSTNTPEVASMQVIDEALQKQLDSKIVNKGNLSGTLLQVQSFTMGEDAEKFGNYISIRNPNINNSTNKYNLFKLDPETGVYNRIPTLGTMGLKEYAADNFTQSSILPKDSSLTKTVRHQGVAKYLDKGTNTQTVLPFIEAQLPASLGIEGILGKYLQSANTPTEVKEFIKQLIEYGDMSAKIVYAVPPKGALGSYNRDTNEITIHPDIYDIELSKNPKLSEVRNVVREVIIEEIIHSMTVLEFNKYAESVDTNSGQVILKDNAPLFAQKLVSLYEAAKTSLPYNPSDISTYYSKDIYEFMAGMFVAEDYRKALEKANPGIVKRFLEALRDMFGSMYQSVTGQPLSYKDETFNAVYDLLKNRNKENPSTKVTPTSNVNPMDEFIQNDTINDTIDDTIIRVTPKVDIKTFTNHSGGAIGADTQWDIIGKEFGMINNKHYFFEGYKTPNGNTSIPISLKNEADSKLIAANKTLKRRFPTSKEFVNNLLRRNWWQVKNSDAVFAVSSITDNKVNGGTGWAVHMAIAENKPVYVFDQVVGKWFTWSEGKFIETITPTLTKNFAGIGTREINEMGKQAIRDVYTKTINPSVQNSTTRVTPKVDTTASWSNLKTQAVYTEQGVNTMRTSNREASYMHFGNPFSEGGYAGTINMPSVGHAIDAFKEWLLGTSYDKVKPEQRAWILEQINSGKLDNATLLYDGKLAGRGLGTHAHALAEIIQQLRNNNSPTTRVTPNQYEGNITPDENTVFVFGSNPLGINGNPVKYPTMSASVATTEFGVVQGEVMDNRMSDSGRAYGLTTVTGPGKKNSMSPSQITNGVKAMYEEAKRNPDKKFKVAYRNTTESSYNGYTGLQMIEMFRDAGPVPSNVYFSKEWVDNGVLKPLVKKTTVMPVKKDGVFELNEDQKKAKKEILDFFKDKDRKTHSLIGYAGSGKTTLLNEIYKEINSGFNDVVFTSPTHRANAVIKLKNPRVEVKTLHSLLGLSIEQDLETFDAADANFVPQNGASLNRGDILIVDESSMINDELFNHLEGVAERLGIKILFVGDNAQLKPVKQAHNSKALSSTEGVSTLNTVMRANNPELLEESMAVRENGSFTYTNNPTNTGVEFSDNRNEKLSEAFEMFKSEEFNENALLVRILAGTNAEVIDINTRMVAALFGKDAPALPENSILMGYNNWNVDYRTKQPKISNGGDYQVINVSDTTTRTLGGVSVRGTNVTIQNILNKKDSAVNTFAIDKNSSKETIEALGKHYEDLRLKAIRSKGRDAAIAWQELSNFKDSFVTTVPITYKGRVKIGKTFDFGYAHTIHKSQGGTYDNVYILDNSIDKFPDLEARKQLRYVAVTRASEKSTIITNKPIKQATSDESNSRRRLPEIKKC